MFREQKYTAEIVFAKFRHIMALIKTKIIMSIEKQFRNLTWFNPYPLNQGKQSKWAKQFPISLKLKHLKTFP